MKKILSYFLTIIFSLAIGICGTIIVYHYYPYEGKNESVLKEVNIKETDSLKEPIEKVYDAVVIIETYKENQALGTGTGFIYKIDDEYGYLLTNAHVIEDATKIQVTNTAQVTVEATLLGSDTYDDIAVLKIDKKAAIKSVTIGKSSNVNLGDTVFTVGSPLGKKYLGTVTKGIISGKDRMISTGNYIMNLLQTDAAINPGNSGGPLVNMRGEVIGINSMKYVEDKIEGMGFAIPIEIAMSVVEKLESGEKIEKPVLGVELIDASNTYALYYNNITIDDQITDGAVVVNVVDGYPAKEAGIKKGDVILEFNNEKVENSAHLRYLLYKYEPGDKVTIKVFRDNKLHDIEVLLSKTAE